MSAKKLSLQVSHSALVAAVKVLATSEGKTSDAAINCAATALIFANDHGGDDVALSAMRLLLAGSTLSAGTQKHVSGFVSGNLSRYGDVLARSHNLAIADRTKAVVAAMVPGDDGKARPWRVIRSQHNAGKKGKGGRKSKASKATVVKPQGFAETATAQDMLAHALGAVQRINSMADLNTVAQAVNARLLSMAQGNIAAKAKAAKPAKAKGRKAAKRKAA